MALLCHDFTIEVSEAESVPLWGCGIAGSCGRGFNGIPMGNSVSVWRLLNRDFRLRRLGPYGIHAHTTVVVHSEDSFDSPAIDQFEVSETLTVTLQRGNENQLRAAFRPFVEELESPDWMKRTEAVVAITTLAPPFLDHSLIELTKTEYALAAIEALRKADTAKSREALAQIADGSGESSRRIEAISNLGRTNDATYLPALLELLESDDKYIQNAAAEAAGELGGSAAITQLATLISNPDAEVRAAGANGLAYSHSRHAVPILIGLLLDPDSNVRQAAENGLRLLTHRAASEGNQWADVTSPQVAASVQLRWVRWWSSHGDTSEIHGMADCAPSESID
jgi:hypothetical protein